MKVNRKTKPLNFTEDGNVLKVHYGNRGEPFREGVEFEFDRQDGRTMPVWVLLNVEEVVKLRDKLNEFLGGQS